VLNWLGKALGGNAKGADGVPAAWAKQLEAAMEAADKRMPTVRKGVAKDVVGFVLRENPIAALAEVGRSDAFAACFGLTYGGGDDVPMLSRKLYPQMHEVPPAVVMRWGQVLAASVGTRSQHWALNLPAGAQWTEALMAHSCQHSVNSWNGTNNHIKSELAIDVIEAALDAAGLPPNALLVACFATPMTGTVWGVTWRTKLVVKLPGYAASVARHLEAVRPHVLPDKVDQRLHVIELLASLDDDGLAAFANELAEHAVSSSKQVRAAVEPLARRVAPFVIEPLKAHATGGKPDQRLHALRLIHLLARARNDLDGQAWAREAALADKAPSVQALPSEWEDKVVAQAADVERYDVEMPTVDWHVALTPALDTQLSALWRDINASVEKSNKANREHHEKQKAQGHKFPLHQDDSYSDRELEAIRTALGTPNGKVLVFSEKRRNNWAHVREAILRLAKHPEATTPMLLKLLWAFGMLSIGNNRGLGGPTSEAIGHVHRRTGKPTLLELSLYLDGMGLHGADEIFSTYMSSYGTIARDWAPAAVWPFFAHHLERLTKLLDPSQRKDYWFDRGGVFRAIATLPTPPATVVNALFDLALSGPRADRALAQAALQTLPGKEARIVNALVDGKADVRTVAAQWLMRLKWADAVPALEKAVVKEKHDVAKGAMLDALQSLGQPVEKYLDRDALAKESDKALEKGLPKDLEWFPWAAMPAVRWVDTGAPVPTSVLRWLLVQAVKQKSPEPNAVLRKYCAMFAPRDREAFGQFVLEAWLAEDVRPNDPEEALKQARANATQIQQAIAQYPKYYDATLKARTFEEHVASYLPALLKQPAGTAIGSKGLLAVVAACAAERVAPPVFRYLKEWYGNRAAQGKALIAMLAWVEHPGATQLMLSIGNRFRTKSFQEEATRQAEALAERKGWTLDELADRTMPSAGFDESGVLELSYGERVFTARLLPDFKVELFNPDGKKIAALPDPRQDDDADRAKDAKKAFSAAKKEIKGIVELQTDRLYEALCTGRDWSFEDWSTYLNQHPVVRRLVQRLVWGVVDVDGKVTATFRPLDDGTLSDNDDNAVAPEANARVRVAHDSNLPAADVQKWQQHLKDYEVKSLFQQFGKGTWTLPATLRGETAVMDFEGHLIEAFPLRGRTGKLGYQRGQTGDGGWFDTYEKRFPTLGLVAVIEFSGNPLPEENRTVALHRLYFTHAKGEEFGNSEIPLGEVPAVLLSECYNDLRLVAADGSGFDPEWQKKSEY
jgi:hypothetical protein